MTKLDKYLKELMHIKKIEVYDYKDLQKLIGINYRTLKHALDGGLKTSTITFEKIKLFVDSWKVKNPEYTPGLNK